MNKLITISLLSIIAVYPVLSNAQEEEGKKTVYDIQIDPYYTAAGICRSLTSRPIEQLGKKTEWEIYSHLLKKIYRPRTIILEASFNPLPYAGAVVKERAPEFYNSMRVNNNLNLVKAVTTGFEEPWAVSLFLGNMVQFESIRKSYRGKRHGYFGMLLDAGNYHIVENELIKDKWLQGEMKLKGEENLSDRSLKWSFRAGFKFHDNINIADSFFVGLRRSRTDFEGKGNFFLNNSSFEYAFDMSQINFAPLRHYFLVEKKFPLKNKRLAFSFGTGFVLTTGNKYSGHLKEVHPGSSFSILLRPNIEF